MKITKNMLFGFLFAISLISLVAWGITRACRGIAFYNDIEGYLKNYERAGSVKRAEESLSAALEALEARGLTKGQISVFFQNPEENITLWYDNLKESREVLREALKKDAFEQASILRDQKVAWDNNADYIPLGISIYPYNRAFFWWGTPSIIATVCFLIVLLMLDEYNKGDDVILTIGRKKART